MEFTNKRIKIALHRERDLEHVVRFFRDEEVIRFICEGDVIPEAKLSEFVTRTSEESNESKKWLFTVVSAADSELVMGCAMFKYDEGIDAYEFGFGLFNEFRGKGLGKELAELILQFGFNYLKLPEIKAIVDPDNENSRVVLQKLGMVFDGNYEHDDRTDHLFSIKNELI